ncbi:MAG: DEAD/DEAH box helicase [Deltaproteobacteria bacterium]|jgi:ATP-dependent RNA helicase RhlB|nr:DEAD/DEAH box helicase [Deltaproteobacteria bacterium]
MPLTVDGTEPVADSEVGAVLGPSVVDGEPDGPSLADDAVSTSQSERAARPNFLTSTRFADLSLPPEIMGGLDAAGFELCTPIQAQVIPVALEGKDIAGQAQTGTGKTTAFLVPLLTRLLRKPPTMAGLSRALVVTPTRELAQQIHKDGLILTSLTNLTMALVMGGMEYREQAQALEAGPDIVICTPGRILDYLQQGIFDPRAVEVAVVDEADRLLDLGFIKDLKRLLSKLPPYTHRQTMLFSATLDDRVLELTYQFMNPPQYITAEPDPASKAQIDQTLYHVSLQEKLTLLLGLLRAEPHHRVLIFCNTKSSVEWLTKKLVLNNFQAEGITGDLPQPKRLRLMEDFKEKRLQIMVATDVASRGIHVEDVSHVYNYDLPQDAESYIHRIGRTARAGKSGKAISFACEDHVFHLEAIENILGAKIPVAYFDEEHFSQDLAGDVKFRDRHPRKGRYSDRAHDRAGGTGDSRSGDTRTGDPRTGDYNRAASFRGDDSRARGPAKSSRPGGIFGLSVKNPVTEENPDLRQHLSWSLASLEGVTSDEVGKDKKTGEGREGRRRKRRRGKREETPLVLGPTEGVAASEVATSATGERTLDSNIGAEEPTPTASTLVTTTEAVVESVPGAEILVDNADAEAGSSSLSTPLVEPGRPEQIPTEELPLATTDGQGAMVVETSPAEIATSETEVVKTQVDKTEATSSPSATEVASLKTETDLCLGLASQLGTKVDLEPSSDPGSSDRESEAATSQAIPVDSSLQLEQEPETKLEPKKLEPKPRSRPGLKRPPRGKATEGEEKPLKKVVRPTAKSETAPLEAIKSEPITPDKSEPVKKPRRPRVKAQTESKPEANSSQAKPETKPPANQPETEPKAKTGSAPARPRTRKKPVVKEDI